MTEEPRLVRVDERLVHGQVLVAWMRYLACSSVCIVDAEVSEDSYIQEVFRLALGSQGTLVVCPPSEAPASWPDWTESLVLLRSPVLAGWLLEQGAAFTRLNLGGLGKRSGRRKLLSNVYVSSEEMDSLRALSERGVYVFYQSVPGEEPVDLGRLLRGQPEERGPGAVGGG